MRIVILLILFFPSAVLASEVLASEKEALVNGISNAYMSPYCPGRTISSCPSPDARALRDEIAVWAGSGEDEPTIISKLETRFGNVIYASPQDGAGGVLKYFPALIFLLGIGLYFSKLTKLKSQSAEPERTQVTGSKDLQDTVDSILESRFK